MNLNYLITAVPRSATKFMSKLFCSAGVSTSHEVFFGFKIENYCTGNYKAESSWMAAPYLDQPALDQTTKIQIVRNPVKVIRSLIARNFLSDHRPEKFQKYTQFARKYTPNLRNKSGINSYIHFWLKWNEIIEKKTDVRFKIEVINKNPNRFFKTIGVGVKGNKLYNDKNTNASRKKPDIPIKTLQKLPLYPDLKHKAANYGYNLP